MLSGLHSSKFSFLLFKAEVPHCSVGSHKCQSHCEPFTESTPRSTNLNGFSIAVASHSFNSVESTHNATIPSSLRSSTPLHCLMDSSIFSSTSVLLETWLFKDFSSVCMCSDAATAESPATPSVFEKCQDVVLPQLLPTPPRRVLASSGLSVPRTSHVSNCVHLYSFHSLSNLRVHPTVGSLTSISSSTSERGTSASGTDRNEIRSPHLGSSSSSKRSPMRSRHLSSRRTFALCTCASNCVHACHASVCPYFARSRFLTDQLRSAQLVSTAFVVLISAAMELRRMLHRTRNPISHAPAFSRFSFPRFTQSDDNKTAAPDLL